MARPKVEIDAATVEKLAQIGCKVKEIADYFNVSDDTISRRFAGELEKGYSQLKMSLRRKQIDVAMKGNVSMLIWLGKQMLGQTDKLDQNIDGKNFKIVVEDYTTDKK